MRIMDLQADIKWIISEIAKVRDPELVSAFKSLLMYRAKQNQADWWDEINEDEKADIEAGIKEIEDGDFVPHSEVMFNARKWL